MDSVVTGQTGSCLQSATFGDNREDGSNHFTFPASSKEKKNSAKKKKQITDNHSPPTAIPAKSPHHSNPAARQKLIFYPMPLEAPSEA
jgi:hypothetical protein